MLLPSINSSLVTKGAGIDCPANYIWEPRDIIGAASLVCVAAILVSLAAFDNELEKGPAGSADDS